MVLEFLLETARSETFEVLHVSGHNLFATELVIGGGGHLALVTHVHVLVLDVLATFLHHRRGNASVGFLVGDDVLAATVLLIQQFGITAALQAIGKLSGTLFVVLTAGRGDLLSEVTYLGSSAAFHVGFQITTDFSAGVVSREFLEVLRLAALFLLSFTEIKEVVLVTDNVTTVRHDGVGFTALLGLIRFEVGGSGDDSGTLAVGMSVIEGTALLVGSVVSEGVLKVGFTTFQLCVVLGTVDTLSVLGVQLAETLLHLLVLHVQGSLLDQFLTDTHV